MCSGEYSTSTILPPQHTIEMKISAEETLPKPLQINDRCMVHWCHNSTPRSAGGDGEQHSSLLSAVVVERRPSRQTSTSTGANNSNKRKYRRSDSSNADIDKLPASSVEYYVHYVDHDRYVQYSLPKLYGGTIPTKISIVFFFASFIPKAPR
jgi:hypothetical protein